MKVHYDVGVLFISTSPDPITPVKEVQSEQGLIWKHDMLSTTNSPVLTLPTPFTSVGNVTICHGRHNPGLSSMKMSCMKTIYNRLTPYSNTNSSSATTSSIAPHSSGCLNRLNTCSVNVVLGSPYPGYGESNCTTLVDALACLRTEDAQCQEPDKTNMVLTSDVLRALSTNCFNTVSVSPGCSARNTTCSANMMSPPAGYSPAQEDVKSYCSMMGSTLACLRTDDVQCQEPEKTIMIANSGLTLQSTRYCYSMPPVSSACLNKLTTCMADGGIVFPFVGIPESNCSAFGGVLACLQTADEQCPEPDRSLMIIRSAMPQAVLTCDLNARCDTSPCKNTTGANPGNITAIVQLLVTCIDSKLAQCGADVSTYSMSNLASGLIKLTEVMSLTGYGLSALYTCPIHSRCELDIYDTNKYAGLPIPEIWCRVYKQTTACILSNIKPCQVIVSETVLQSLNDAWNAFNTFCSNDLPTSTVASTPDSTSSSTTESSTPVPTSSSSTMTSIPDSTSSSTTESSTPASTSPSSTVTSTPGSTSTTSSVPSSTGIVMSLQSLFSQSVFFL
ncbi:serine-rich adhesin for platelets-like [Gigantopelta aegis]|uniref:serine-rich adhesin for platelets-like n=1 Tax=Gigantopelta aegis TaxID=1735272 RepID=UPI001B887FBB|nr:serine-rich adhesin for platelets-like [Gigantopelta aegis]